VAVIARASGSRKRKPLGADIVGGDDLVEKIRGDSRLRRLVAPGHDEGVGRLGKC